MRCLVSLAVALAAGALAGTGLGAASRVIPLDLRSNGRTVRAHEGDTIVVRLPSNPGTGYAWHVVSRGAPVLRILSTRYVPPKPTTPPTLGAPGSFVARIAVRRQGRAVFRLAYRRTTTPPSPPAKRFSFTLLAAR